tara:strand:+ start:16392 stop:16859 length:468 start_codon:yes stop_codon:yes gene_type:complete
MIISFTGHRLDKIGIKIPSETYYKIYKSIEDKLKELKPSKTISGMALGVDQISAIISYRLNIPFIAAIPFKGQENLWNDKEKITYNKLLKLSCEQVVVNTGAYSASHYQTRNEWMVDNSDLLIAIFNGSKSGTANCVNYAKSKNKQSIIINPSDL